MPPVAPFIARAGMPRAKAPGDPLSLGTAIITFISQAGGIVLGADAFAVAVLATSVAIVGGAIPASAAFLGGNQCHP